MRSISRCIVGCYLGLICATALCNEAYHFVTEIPIGGEGGWDILTIDSAASRLYLSHATKVVVVDLNTEQRDVGEIADTPGVHAFVAVPEVQRGFSSNGKESKSSVVDLTTLKTTSKIDTGSNPDAVVYEPRHGEVYVFNHTWKFGHRYQRQNRYRLSDDSAWRKSRICGGRSSSRACLLQHRRQERSRGDRRGQT